MTLTVPTPAFAFRSSASVLSVGSLREATDCTAQMAGTPLPGSLMVAMHRGGSTTSVSRGGMTEQRKPTAAEAAGCLQQMQAIGDLLCLQPCMSLLSHAATIHAFRLQHAGEAHGDTATSYADVTGAHK